MTAIRISVDTPLVAGETVLCARRDVRVGSALSLPSYRLFFTLPPLLEVGLLVTDQRVVLQGLCLRLLSFSRTSPTVNLDRCIRSWTSGASRPRRGR